MSPTGRVRSFLRIWCRRRLAAHGRKGPRRVRRPSVTGEPSIEPRVTPAPVRMPLPAALTRAPSTRTSRTRRAATSRSPVRWRRQGPEHQLLPRFEECAIGLVVRSMESIQLLALRQIRSRICHVPHHVIGDADVVARGCTGRIDRQRLSEGVECVGDSPLVCRSYCRGSSTPSPRPGLVQRLSCKIRSISQASLKSNVGVPEIVRWVIIPWVQLHGPVRHLN